MNFADSLILQKISLADNPINYITKIFQMNNNYAIYIGTQKHNPQQDIHDYASQSQLYSILAEITRIVARKNNLNIHHAISEYLNQCNKGEHVVLKSYSSFSKSPLNRQCFLYNFLKIFEIQANTRNGLDYFQLFRLLCSDFPKEIVTNAVRLIEDDVSKNMAILLNSKIFTNALYINFIYHEYLDTILHKLFQGDPHNQIPLIDLYNWIKTSQEKGFKKLQKPKTSVQFQIILNTLHKESLIKIKGITFLNEGSIEEFIKLSIGGENPMISYLTFCRDILDNKQHQMYVQKSLNYFDNSIAWGTEVSKLLCHKDGESHPINTKKIKKK